MARFNRIVKITNSVLSAGFISLAASSALANPVGHLQIDGRVDVQASGTSEAVQISQADYTVFSGDRIATRSGSTVLTLNGGGALGLAPSSSASVTSDHSDGEMNVNLENGTLLFSLPSSANAVRISLGGFVLRPQPRGTWALRVNSGGADDLVGMVRRLDDGHIHVSVTDGELHLTSGKGSVYRVRAGDEIGLLAAAGSVARVNTQSGRGNTIRIEAPEQVGTNEEFRIRWDGSSDLSESYITVAPEGADPEEFERVVSANEGNMIELEAPANEGDYEIRYVDGETGEVSSFVYLRVVGDQAVVPWIASNQALITGVTVAAAGGGAVLLLDDDDDDGPTSVSP